MSYNSSDTVVIRIGTGTQSDFLRPTGPQGPTGPQFVGLPVVDNANRIYKTQTTINAILSTPQDIHTGANFQVNTISLGQAGRLSFEEAGPKTGVSIYANQYNAKNDFVSKSQIIYSGFVNQFQNIFATPPGSTFTGNCGSINISNTRLVLNTVFSKPNLNSNFIHNGILIDQDSFYTPNPSPFTGGIPNIAGLQISALGNGPVKNAYGAVIRNPLTGTNCSMGVFTDSLSVGGNNITVRPPLNGMLVQGDIVLQNLIGFGDSVSPTIGLLSKEQQVVSMDLYTEKLIAQNISGPTGSNVHCYGLNTTLTGGIISGIPTNPFVCYIEGEFTAQVNVNYVQTKIDFSYQIEGDTNETNNTPWWQTLVSVIGGFFDGGASWVEMGIMAIAEKVSNSSGSNVYGYSANLNPGTTQLPIAWFRTIGDAKANNESDTLIHYLDYPANRAIYNCPVPAPTNIKCRYTRYGKKVTLHLGPFSFTSFKNPYVYGSRTFNNEGLDYYYTINNLPSCILQKNGSESKSKIPMYISYEYPGKSVNYYHVNDLYSSDVMLANTSISSITSILNINSDGAKIYADSNDSHFKRGSTSGWPSTIVSYSIDPTVPYT